MTKRSFIYAIIAGVLAACAVGTSFMSATNTAEYLSEQYDDITELLYVVEMSPEELDTITNALQTASRVRKSFSRYLDNPETVLSRLTVIQIEYDRLRVAYESVRTIVLTHKEEYPPIVWETFELFDANAQILDRDVETIRTQVQLNEALATGLQITNALVKLIALV